MELSMLIDGYGAKEHPLLATPQFRDVIELFARTGTIQSSTLGLYLHWRLQQRSGDLWNEPKLRRLLPPAGIAADRKQVGGRSPAQSDEGLVRELASPYARIMAAGGCVSMGSHGNIPGLGAHYELAYFTKGGMSSHDALRAATLCSAESIGHAGDLGSLEVGKLADLQVLERNPLDDIDHSRAIRYVMKNGRLFEADTLDEVWPRQRKLRPLWWWSGATN